MPADPITALLSAAVQLHELYEAFRAAGFKDEQALAMTQSALAAVIVRPKS